MAGVKPTPKGVEEELSYYKGMHQFRELAQDRVNFLAGLHEIDLDIARKVMSFRKFVSWREIAEVLDMSEAQARNFLIPLMAEVENEE